MEANTVNTYLAWAAIFAGIIGPISAVTITLIWEKFRRSRELKFNALQNMLSTRGRYADPIYSLTIRNLPITFAKNKKVMKAYEAFIDAASVSVTEENQEAVLAKTSNMESLLITEMMNDIGFRHLNAEKVGAFTAGGLASRERLLEDALLSLPHLAVSAKRSADAAEKMTLAVTTSDIEPEIPN